jgi:DNA-binding MarR family transcriptional regulator
MIPKFKSDLKFEDMLDGMLFAYIVRTHTDIIRRRLESYGIQKTYGPILKELSINEGMTQIELAGKMIITAPSMSVNLQKMENAGFLIRKSDDADMRQIRLYLTDKGKETAEKADREIALAEKKLIESLSTDEQQELKRLLLKIIKSQTEGDSGK